MTELQLVRSDEPEPLPLVPHKLTFQCFNGPCQGAAVDAPADATPGTACALPWKTVEQQDRYAIYVLVDWNGTKGLMYLKSYQKPAHAVAKVHQLSALCAAGMS